MLLRLCSELMSAMRIFGMHGTRTRGNQNGNNFDLHNLTNSRHPHSRASDHSRSQMRWKRMTHQIPSDHNALLTRDQAAAALTAAGFPVKAKTLATKATRGGGPPYQSFGARVLYRWGDALAWAEARLSPRITSTSELDAA